jgi:hypothetical protein
VKTQIPASLLLCVAIGAASVTGCAYMSGDRQAVAVSSTLPDSKIYHQSQLLGLSPQVVEIDRGPRTSFEARSLNRSEFLDVDGQYRWKKSFFPNLIFILAGPAGPIIGWGVDWWTGAAFEYPGRVVVGPPLLLVSSNSLKPSSASSRTYKVAIVPPASDHPDVSDEVGRRLDSLLQAELGEGFQVLPYQSTFERLRAKGVDYGSPIEESQLPEMQLSTQADFLFKSDVQLDSENITISGRLISSSYEVQDNFKKMNWQLSRETVAALASESVYSANSTPRFWWPNSIALDLGESNTSLTINQREVIAESEPIDGVWGDISKYLSALSLRKVFPPSKRPGWHSRFDWVPTASFSMANEVFPTLSEIDELTFTRVHFDFGYGAHWSYGSQSWNFYLNFFPVFSYDDISTHAGGRDLHESGGRLATASEVGIGYHFSQSWHTRFYVRIASVDSRLWSDLMRRATGQNFAIEDSDIVNGGFAIGYIWPDNWTNKLLK